MDFEALLNMLRNPGEEGPGETIYDDLSASYTEMSSTSGAKVEELNALVATLSAELTAAKAHNYDLLMQTGVGSGSGEPEPDDSGDSDGESDADSIGDDDDFFEDKD